MKQEFHLRLNTLSKELDDFYYQEFETEQAEYSKNKQIKQAIVQFILEMKEHGEYTLIDEALNLIFHNTGCHIDCEILDEIMLPVIEKNIITQELINKNLRENSPMGRWF
ncbi:MULTISPECIES: hypothetical protein [Enterobacterales]|uniref:hypothetical protein n=1 Tax=Enterobacterales TaxID=91347 RepID=UPI000847FEBC|nr:MULTISPECIES: hypothetical protein [Enterobacterales]ODQ06031.1 hypothetical protein BGK50_02605 [Shigella sp. FC130]OEI93543.1 hypothetical protein BHE86_02615 [Shigella sp. FC1655]WOO50620.1 hypothetical protein R2S03_05385 [Hafnia alvei]WPF05088.1 hypothetical protein SB028_04235 [Proteus vulgaris]